MAAALAFIDLGTSGTKALWSSDEAEDVHSFQCPSAVVEMSLSELKLVDMQGEDLGSGRQSLMYVQARENGKAYALGQDATVVHAISASQLPKVRKAYYRILGVLGEIALALQQSTLTVAVGVMLPFSEYSSDKASLEDKLQSLSSFIYRGQTITLQLEIVKVLPEGGGVMEWFKIDTRRQGRPVETAAVLCLGYRDCSMMMYRQGKPPTSAPGGNTLQLGFIRYLEQVKAAGLPGNAPESELFQFLIHRQQKVSFSNRPGDSWELNKLVQSSKPLYLGQLREAIDQWGSQVALSQCTLLITGGTAEAFRPELTEFFSERSTLYDVNWLDKLKQEMKAALPEMSRQMERARFSDCYGGMMWLSKLVQSKVKQHA